MEKKLYIPPFIEVIKPIERVPLLSLGTGQFVVTSKFTDEGGDAKDFWGMEEMHDEFWGVINWD